MKNQAFRITFDKKKAVLGALLGVLFMVLIFTQRNTHLYDNVGMGKAYQAGIPLALVFFVVGLV